MSKNIVVSLLCVLVVVVVAVSTLPVFGAINSGAVTVENEGAGALRFDLVDSHSGFNISYDFGDDNLTITNGSDVQTISNDSDDMITIYYADDNVCIWLDGTDFIILGITSDNSTLCAYITDNFTVQRTLSGVTITYGMESASFNAPTWAFIPNSAGKYGYFDAGTEVSLPEGARVAYVSDNFAGVYAYNGINNFNLPITLEPEILDNVLSGAKWIKVIEELEEDPLIIPFDPGITPINPNIPIVIDDPDDPIVIDDPPNVIMAVPTPTYTDGDWGYDLGYNNEAKIVSYSGSGGNITIPATVGGHPVTSVGVGTMYQTVFDPSLVVNDLVISSGITKINTSAFFNLTNITGSLTLPNTLTEIGSAAFQGCGFTGSLVIPDSVTKIGNSAFYGCTGFTGSLVIPDSVTKIEGHAFHDCTGFTGSLVLPTYLTELYAGAFNNCTGLTGSIVIPEGITTIPSDLFYGCAGLTGPLVIPEWITKIESSAFRYCSGFTELILPSTITSIASSAFRNCTGLNSMVSFMDNSVSINSSSFSTTTNLKEVLNLGSLELTTTSYGLHANEIHDYVNCIGYLAPVEYTTGSANDGPAYDLLGLIPLVFAVGAVLFTVGYVLLRKF